MVHPNLLFKTSILTFYDNFVIHPIEKTFFFSDLVKSGWNFSFHVVTPYTTTYLRILYDVF